MVMVLLPAALITGTCTKAIDSDLQAALCCHSNCSLLRLSCVSGTTGLRALGRNVEDVKSGPGAILRRVGVLSTTSPRNGSGLGGQLTEEEKRHLHSCLGRVLGLPSDIFAISSTKRS